MIHNKVLSLISGIIIGLMIFLIGETKDEGGKPKIGFNIILYKNGNNCVHIHHWLLILILESFIILFVLLSKGTFNIPVLFTLGFGIGASLADFRYKDAFKFNIKCN